MCTRVLANSIRNLADSALLPHDFVAYGNALTTALTPKNYGDWFNIINKNAEENFDKESDSEEYDQVEINFVSMTSNLKKNANNFIKEAKEWSRSFKDKGKIRDRFYKIQISLIRVFTHKTYYNSS